KTIPCFMQDSAPKLFRDGEPCKACPAKEEQQTSEWCDRSQYSDTAECQYVETSRKQHNTCRERPSRHHQQTRTAEMPYRGGDDQHGERMIHLIAHTSFKHREHLRRKPASECVSAKSSEHHTQEAE